MKPNATSVNSTPNTTNTLSTTKGVDENIQIIKKASFGQRTVTFVKDVVAYCWAACKTFFTVGFAKFKIAVRQVHAFDLISSFKYINIKNMRIYAGKNPNICKDIDIDDCKKVLDNQGQVLTEKSINKIVDEFKNLKTTTLYFDVRQYKKDNNINPNKRELSLEEALDKLISCINTKLQNKTQHDSTIKLFIETDNNQLVKDKLFNVYNKICSGSKKKDHHSNHTIDTQPKAINNPVIETTTTENLEHNSSTQQAEGKLSPSTILGKIQDKARQAVNKISSIFQPKPMQPDEQQKNEFINRLIVKKWPEIEQPKYSAIKKALFATIKKVETIKNAEQNIVGDSGQSLEEYVSNMPDFKFIKLGLYTKHDVFIFKTIAVEFLIAKGYQYQECEPKILEELFTKSANKKDLNSNLKKYPKKDPDNSDLAQKLGITAKEASDKVAELTEEISQKLENPNTDCASTMAKYLLERNKNNNEQLTLNDMPSLLEFSLGYTTKQEYDEINTKNINALTSKKYAEEDIVIILKAYNEYYTKSDLITTINQFPASNRYSKIIIACNRLGIKIPEYIKIITEFYEELCKRNILIHNDENQKYFANTATDVLLRNYFKDVNNLKIKLLNAVANNINRN